jgi:hypothetical protein
MATANARRRGHGEDAIYFDAAKNRYIGAVSLGYEADGRRVRRKVSGKTKQEVRHKLKEDASAGRCGGRRGRCRAELLIRTMRV